MTASSDWRLYVILDPAAAKGRDLPALAEAAIAGGADVLQLRDKSGDKDSTRNAANRILRVSRPAGVPFIINDYPDIAREVDADGVHLGQEDGTILEARAILGKKGFIGRSTHSLEQALKARGEGADYIGFGPIFATPTKPNYTAIGIQDIGAVHERLDIPIVCVGGIDSGNIERVANCGARCVAVVRAVIAAEDPESAARTLKANLEQFSGIS